jgi:hypothetical protein
LGRESGLNFFGSFNTYMGIKTRGFKMENIKANVMLGAIRFTNVINVVQGKSQWSGEASTFNR